MASDLHILVVVDTDDGISHVVASAVDGACAFVEHLERCWSRFIESSDVSRINRLGRGGGTIRVDPTTVTLLESMVEGYKVTAGRYDPTVLRAVVAEGYDTSLEDPTRVCDVVEGSTRAGALLELECDRATAMVTVPPGLVVDPGGIGKGLAADLAVAKLLEWGVDGAMVGIGGDLAMSGRSVDAAGWLVEVEYPDPTDGLLCSLAVSGGGVATSSTRSRRWTHRGRERHHQIDARTSSCSTTDLATATVIAASGWLAEVHATAALAGGAKDVLDYLDGHGLSGIAVVADPVERAVLRTADLGDVDIHERGTIR